MIAPRRGPAVEALGVLGGLLVVAGRAVDAPGLLDVRKFGPGEILVARHAFQIPVNRGGERPPVHVDGELPAPARAAQSRVLVAHEAFVVSLGPDERAGEQKRRDHEAQAESAAAARMHETTPSLAGISGFLHAAGAVTGAFMTGW